MHVARTSPLWDVEDAEYIPDIVASEAPGALERALASGASPPLRFMGVGAFGFVFCDVNGAAFKVGRHWKTPYGRRSMATEAEWLDTATRVPWVQNHVAHFRRFDAERSVIVRECVIGRKGGWKQPDLWSVHREIESQMLPYGWGAPEYKQDSYVIARGRGAVLVDASMPRRVGRRLVEHALDVLAARAQDHEDLRDLAFYIRVETREGSIPEDIGQRIEKRLQKAYVESTT